MQEHEIFDYSKEYSEKSLWEKIGSFALAAGKGTIEKVLILYYCLQRVKVTVYERNNLGICKRRFYV